MTRFPPVPCWWFAAAAFIVATPAIAGNTLIAKGAAVAVAKSTLTVAPDREWNRMGARPGRNSETWTIDGDALNDLTFYGGIEDGKTLFREVSKRTRPLPRFSSTMLLTDIPALVETSYHTALDTPLMTIDAVEPDVLAGSKAVRFRYHFTRRSDEVERQGEGVAAIVGGKLYMTTFEAPTLYFFDRDVEAFRTVVKMARIG